MVSNYNPVAETMRVSAKRVYSGNEMFLLQTSTIHNKEQEARKMKYLLLVQQNLRVPASDAVYDPLSIFT